MSEKEKLVLLEEAFDVEEGELKPNMALDTIENWDSMTRLALIALMSTKFGKSLKKQDIQGFKTVQDILDWME